MKAIAADPSLAKVVPRLTGWVTTFLMAPHNTRIVRRSNGLLSWAYGKQFRYREVHRMLGRFAPLAAAAIATGPSAETRDRGFFAMDTFTRTTTGVVYRAKFAMDGDPGYKATAVILGEVGLCLALDRGRLSPLTGVLTPAAVIAEPLAGRLRAAGARIDVRREVTQ